MKDQLIKEMEAHLLTFPDRQRFLQEQFKDMEEIRKDWEELKTKALWVVFSMAGGILVIGVWVGTIQSTISTVNEARIEADAERAILTQRITSIEVVNSEIKARLASIDTALQEIKLAIKGI